MKEVTKVTFFGFKITRWLIIFNFIPKNYHKSYNWFKMSKIVDHMKIKNSNLVQKHENGKLEKILSILTVCNVNIVLVQMLSQSEMTSPGLLVLKTSSKWFKRKKIFLTYARTTRRAEGRTDVSVEIVV